jgi:hypothetical protein
MLQIPINDIDKNFHVHGINWTHYMHEVEHVYLVHHIHEFNDMNEIKETIKILKNLIPLFIFCEFDVCKKNGQKGCKQISKS